MGKRIEWKGGECPVSGDTLVRVYLRNNDKVEVSAKSLVWRHYCDPGDIISYEVIEEAKEEPKTEKTLWDEYAMAAITGMLADSNVVGNVDSIVEYVSKVADAMMKARAK